jgi:hypothetical protein
MGERDEAFEELKAGHGLLRELPGLRVWGVDDGALVLGEDATQFLFCSQGALVVRPMPRAAVTVREVRRFRRGMGVDDVGMCLFGPEREEVVRLVNRAGMPAQVTKGRAGAFNRAWVPGKG